MSIDQTFPDEHYYLLKEKEKREAMNDKEIKINSIEAGILIAGIDNFS